MDASLDRLRQIADEIRVLPDVFPSLFDNMSTGVPLVDEALGRKKGVNTSRLMEAGGKLIDEAIQLGAFGGWEHAGFRVDVRDSKAVSPETWQYEVFNWAGNEFTSMDFAMPDSVRRACGPIADAIEAEIQRMKTTPPPAKTEQGEGNGGADGKKPRKRKRKADPKVAQRREERKAR